MLQKGAEVQEQTAQRFAEMLHGAGSTNYWQQQGLAAMEQMAETSQKNLDDGIRVMNENARTSMELLERALHSRVGGAPEKGSEAIQETLDLGLAAMRSNVEAVVQANARVIDSWAKVFKLMSVDAEQPPE